MGNNPFLFPSAVSHSQPSLPSSPSFNSYIPSPSPSFDSYSPSSPSLNSPFQFYQSLPSPPSQISSNHFGLPSTDAVGPCAACTILHRQCTDKCYLASYFPQGVEPHNFTVVDSLFGLSNVVEFLQQNSGSLSYIPLLLLLRDTSKDESQIQANPSKIIKIVPNGTAVNINDQPMLANSENSKAHSYSCSSKPAMMFGTNNAGTLTSPVNKFGDHNDLELQADVEDESLKGNVDPGNIVAPPDDSEGFTFVEVNSVRAGADKVVCCDFSSDGKLLASGGHDKKVVLWDTERENLKSKAILEEHSSLITSVRFSPRMPQLATSSFDKTVKVWDTDDPNDSICTFTGHSTSIMSIDFHPFKDDLICSCDADSEMRYWSIQTGACLKVLKGGTVEIRFQPRLGRYLAAADENVVNIFDVETQARVNSFQGHCQPIDSLCWDPSGEYLATVSVDSVRLWCLRSGSVSKCVHVLSCVGNKFQSCVFHPTDPSLLVIGCYKFLELWNVAENKTMTLPAHEGLISALAVSPLTRLIATASHDKFIKLWK